MSDDRKLYLFPKWLCNYIFKFTRKQINFVFIRVRARVIVSNAIFNNFSVISWRSVLLLEESEVPVENHRPAASH